VSSPVASERTNLLLPFKLDRQIFVSHAQPSGNLVLRNLTCPNDELAWARCQGSPADGTPHSLPSVSHKMECSCAVAAQSVSWHHSSMFLLDRSLCTFHRRAAKTSQPSPWRSALAPCRSTWACLARTACSTRCHPGEILHLQSLLLRADRAAVSRDVTLEMSDTSSAM